METIKEVKKRMNEIIEILEYEQKIEYPKNIEDKQLIKFGIWLHDTVMAVYQLGGQYEGMWYAHIKGSNKDYFTNEEIINYWKIK
jgi:hypothetical protein